MTRQGKLAIALGTAFSALTAVAAPNTIEVKDGGFVVNGERFFVKGIGYCIGGGRWGFPRQRTFDRELMERDIAMIKAAGFNTVRCWDEYTVEELKVFREHGLMVILGSWFSMERYLVDPPYAKHAQENLAKVVRVAKDFDNILFHTITNEPHMKEVLTAGIDAYEKACREMRAVARREDPACRVTFSHMSANELLDQSPWDVTFLNSYVYVPNTVTHSLKYRGHIEWLKARHGAHKPFVIGEFGLSVSPDGPGKMGYGGNTLAEQRDGCLHMYQSIIDAGAQGGCLFHWRDGWFKFDDSAVHSRHPEEWYGILAIEDETSDPRGTPRPVYHAFREYNQLIVTEPRQMVAYAGAIPVRAFATENVTGVRCRLGDGPWIELAKRSASWWGTDLAQPGKGTHRVEIEARLSLPDVKQIRRTIDFVAGDEANALPSLSLTTDKETYAYGDTAMARVHATKPDGTPLAGVPVVLTYQSHYSGEGRTLRGTTDADGAFAKPFPLYMKPTLITFGAGAEVRTGGVTHNLWDARGIEVTGVLHGDIVQAVAGKGRLIEGFEYATENAFLAARGRVLGGAARYTAEWDATIAKEGKAALKLHFEPEARHSWGYTEVFLEQVQDISGDRAISVWVHGDGSGQSIKILLIDEDRERWHDEEVALAFKGWKRIIFGAKGLARDPFDGITNGDNRPNPDKLAGFAFAMRANNAKPATILVDGITAHP